MRQKPNPALAAAVFASLIVAAGNPATPEITSGPSGQPTVTQQTQRTNESQGQKAPTTQQAQQLADDPNGKTLFHTRRNIMRRLRRYMEKQGLIKGPRQWKKLLANTRRTLKDPEYQALINAD